MWPVDRELPCPERAEALNKMLRHRGVVGVAAAVPTARGKPPEWLVDAGNPRLLGAAGVAHEAVHKQFWKTAIEGARQCLDHGGLAHVDVDHREIAVEPQA